MSKLILNEVGLEQELFLLDKQGNILEPSLYGFPADEMGFLVELRSEHYDFDKWILDSLEILETLNWNKADDLEFELVKVHELPVTKEFQEYIATKYKHASLPNYTRNIHGLTGTHHTGFQNRKATAGLHVHFSSRTIKGTKCWMNELPVDSIVSGMDYEFADVISKSSRIEGEWEPKVHGFEYRSLPTTADVDKVVTVALRILNELVPPKPL